MATPSTLKLKTVEEVRLENEKRKNQIDSFRPSPEISPPCPGAMVFTCQNGENAGKRYWALKSVNQGVYNSTFLGWIDEPALTLKQRIDQQDKEIAALKEAVELFKKKSKKFRDDDSE
jgi:hypothetical protein